MREIAQDAEVTETRDVEAYTERGVPDYTDGPPVKRLLHQGHGHSEEYTENCVTCGRRVARFLHRLRVGGQGKFGDALPKVKWVIFVCTERKGKGIHQDFEK